VSFFEVRAAALEPKNPYRLAANDAGFCSNCREVGPFGSIRPRGGSRLEVSDDFRRRSFLA
jgi:hypothetical protein